MNKVIYIYINKYRIQFPSLTIQVVVDMLRKLCIPESLIPIDELTDNEMETELKIIWCEKYKLSEEGMFSSSFFSFPFLSNFSFPFLIKKVD
jgi:hypothetical protein